LKEIFLRNKNFKVRNIIHINNLFIKKLTTILLIKEKSIPLVIFLANKEKRVSNKIHKLSQKINKAKFKINNLRDHDLKK